MTSVPPSTGPAVIPPIEYPLAAPRVVQFEDCSGGIGLAVIPMDKAQAVVPDDFEITYGFGVVPRVAGVHMMAVTCSRVVVNTTIVENVSWFRIAVFAAPKNESWRDNGIHRYLVDSWFSAAELNDWFAPTQMPTEVAEFRREALPAGSPVRTDRWNVDAPSCDVAAEFHISGQPGPSVDDVIFLWVGAKPYQRLDLFEGKEPDRYQVSAVPFEIKGTCPSQQVLEGTRAQAAEYMVHFNATLSVTGKMFG